MGWRLTESRASGRDAPDRAAAGTTALSGSTCIIFAITTKRSITSGRTESHVSAVYFHDAWSELLGPARGKRDELTQHHKDIARSAQAMYEEAFFHLLITLHKRHGLDRLALAGGCAMNSVANGKIFRNTPFKRIYIQSAAGDAGGAIGAAFVAWHKIRKGRPWASHPSHFPLAGTKGLP